MYDGIGLDALDELVDCPVIPKVQVDSRGRPQWIMVEECVEHFVVAAGQSDEMSSEISAATRDEDASIPCLSRRLSHHR